MTKFQSRVEAFVRKRLGPFDPAVAAGGGGAPANVLTFSGVDITYSGEYVTHP